VKTTAVNCAFIQVQVRLGKAIMKQNGGTISDEEIAAFIPSLNTTKAVGNKSRERTASELRQEAKLKLTKKRACELAPKCSLYALRHSWATNAMQKGVDAVTVAVLMGHEELAPVATLLCDRRKIVDNIVSRLFHSSGATLLPDVRQVSSRHFFWFRYFEKEFRRRVIPVAG